jgi:hypothetical protein
VMKCRVIDKNRGRRHAALTPSELRKGQEDEEEKKKRNRKSRKLMKIGGISAISIIRR